MIDCFIRVFSSSELRLGFAIATVARWKMQKDVTLTTLVWEHSRWYDFKCDDRTIENNPAMPFATASLKMAEEMAQSDPYIICNDDNLPYGQDFVEKGLRLMQEFPDYGIIAGRVVNDDQYKSEERLTEIHAVGGLVFLRKGLVTEFKPLEDAFWDGYRHAQITAKGFKSGHSRDLPFLHMGARFSVANPSHFNGA